MIYAVTQQGEIIYDLSLVLTIIITFFTSFDELLKATPTLGLEILFRTRSGIVKSMHQKVALYFVFES